MRFFLLVTLVVVVDIGLVLGALLAFWSLRDRVVARRKRLAAERATWAESVTKQTKPPPMVAAQSKSPEQIREEVLRMVERMEPPQRDPNLDKRLASAKSTEGRDRARQHIAAEKVRRATKRRK